MNGKDRRLEHLNQPFSKEKEIIRWLYFKLLLF